MTSSTARIVELDPAPVVVVAPRPTGIVPWVRRRGRRLAIGTMVTGALLVGGAAMLFRRGRAKAAPLKDTGG